MVQAGGDPCARCERRCGRNESGGQCLRCMLSAVLSGEESGWPAKMTEVNGSRRPRLGGVCKDSGQRAGQWAISAPTGVR